MPVRAQSFSLNVLIILIYKTMSRVFVAINLTDGVRDKLEEVKRELIDSFDMAVEEGAGNQVAKWVKKDNLHITMQFIGEVDNKQIMEGVRLLPEKKIAGWQKFKVKIGCVSYGAKDKGVPRLIWAEIDGNKDLECIAQMLGNKNFKPHITLGRVRQWVWKKIDPEERPNIEQDLSIEFEVKSIDLMESKLSRTGPSYKILKSIKLQ